MDTNPRERGQALIIIVLTIVGLFGLTGLVIDGGVSYSDRRKAQNAADSAALAAALGDIRERDITTTAKSTAAVDGFDDNGTSNWVTVSSKDAPPRSCADTPKAKDITVQIRSVLNTYFATVIGIRQVGNTVTATARACEPYVGPLFNGDAIVALTHKRIGFDAAGTPEWNVSGGGIFSNSSDDPSARCQGAAGLTTPSLTTVGNPQLSHCRSVHVGQTTTGAEQLVYADYANLLPPIPKCNGTAKKVGNYWVAEPGAEGSRVAFNGDMQFGSGLYCVTNSPGPFHNRITGIGVTFYLMPPNFSMKLNGGGSSAGCNGGSGNGNGGGNGNGSGSNSGGGAGLGAPLIASTIPGYAGILMFSAPQVSGGLLQQTQELGFYGNGSGNISGSIIVPSAHVTMFGNSNGAGYQTQIIAYNVDSGGCSNININYDASLGYNGQFPATVTLLK